MYIKKNIRMYSYIFILLYPIIFFSNNGINIILIFIFSYLIVVLKIVFEKMFLKWLKKFENHQKFINFNIYT